MIIKNWMMGALALSAMCTAPAHAQEVVRLGNLKFAHHRAILYTKEIAPKCDPD